MKSLINLILGFVLAYPLVFYIPSLLGIEVFGLTAPYFFLLFVFAALVVLIYPRLQKIPQNTLFLSLGILLLSAGLNFSSLRYSLPLFFVVYTLVLSFILFHGKEGSISDRVVKRYFTFLIIASVPCLFLESGFDEMHRFQGFIGSPTIYAGFLAFLLIISTYNSSLKSVNFIVFYAITLYLVLLSKTRLLIIFLLVYPFLLFLLRNKSWASKKLIFGSFFVLSFMIYPMYSFVTYLFPGLVTLRYEDNRDASFGLRVYLFDSVREHFSEGNFFQILFGFGNEYSRLFVKDLIGIDLMPHNDFMRILMDWGLLGFFLFCVILFKIALKNSLTMLLTMVYIILFYSNTVFNLFLISILLLFYFIPLERKASRIVFTQQ